VEIVGDPGELAALGDAEVEISAGIFRLHDGEVCYGFFEELEDLLVKKAVPFDRQTSMDWDIIPCNRVFRPGDAENFDREFILNPDTYEPCVSLKDIRELLVIDDAGEQAAAAIRRYIDDKFPVYPPLTDYVVGDLQDFQPTPIDPPDEDKCHEDTENVFIVGVNALYRRN